MNDVKLQDQIEKIMLELVEGDFSDMNYSDLEGMQMAKAIDIIKLVRECK